MKALFRKVDWKPTVKFAAVAALLFCVAVFIYIYRASYADTWIIYVGSFAFLAVMYTHNLYDSKQRGHNESTVTMVFNSHLTTIIGIVMCVVVSFLLLVIFVPGYPAMNGPQDNLSNEPANTIQDRTDGLSFNIFMAATVINFSVGSFCGIIIPFTAKRNQTKDQKDPAPLHQTGTR